MEALSAQQPERLNPVGRSAALLIVFSNHGVTGVLAQSHVALVCKLAHEQFIELLHVMGKPVNPSLIAVYAISSAVPWMESSTHGLNGPNVVKNVALAIHSRCVQSEWRLLVVARPLMLTHIAASLATRRSVHALLQLVPGANGALAVLRSVVQLEGARAAARSVNLRKQMRTVQKQ
jgi:hypothetical protein